MNNTKTSGLYSIRGHHIYANFLRDDSIVIDMGSHLGQFSHQVSKLFGCQCYAIEALPSLFNKIKETSLVKKFNYAISSKSQPLEFCISDNPEANHIATVSFEGDGKHQKIQVNGITLNDFLEENNIDNIDLLKVDIEGAEFELFSSLNDETICQIKQITIEFHDFMFDCKNEVKKIKKRLKSLGFVYVVFSRKNNGDVLFINTKKCQIFLLNWIYIKYISKYIRGLIRLVKNN